MTARAAMTLALFAGLLSGGPAAGVAAQSPVTGAPIAQEPGVVGGPGSANYPLASRWAPYKLEELVHSTMVTPRWIEGSSRFWYEWETSDGSSYWIADMSRGEQAGDLRPGPPGGGAHAHHGRPV